MVSLSTPIPCLALAILIIASYQTIPSNAVSIRGAVWCTFTQDTCRWKVDSKKGLSFAILPRLDYGINSDGPVTLPRLEPRPANALVVNPLNLLSMATETIDNRWGWLAEKNCLQFDYYLFGPYSNVQLLYQSTDDDKEYVVWGRSVNSLNKDRWSSFQVAVPNERRLYQLEFRVLTKEFSYAAIANVRASARSECKQTDYCDFDISWPGMPIEFHCNWLTFQNGSDFGWTHYRTDTNVPIDHSSKDSTGRMLSTTRGGSRNAVAKVFFKRSNKRYNCFTFWYYKLSSNMSDEIFAYSTANGMSTRLWSNDRQGIRDPAGQWNHVRVSIPSVFDGKIEDYETGIGIVKKSDNMDGRIFIDTMTLSPGQCPRELSCEFSTNTCAYNAPPGKYRWSIGKGRVANPAKLGENFTLPDYDHDFLYIDSTTNIDIVSNPDKMMKLVSESANARTECVSFDFYKSRIDNKVSKCRDSEVTMKITSTSGKYNQTWYIHAKELNTWNKQLFPIQASTDFKIAILVDTDRLDGTFVAFKDLVVKPGDCPEPKPEECPEPKPEPRGPGMYDCNFDSHPLNEIDESKGQFCNWQSTPLQKNSFRLGKSSSFKCNQSLPRHDHTSGSKKGRFLIGSINTFGESAPLSLNMNDQSFDGDLCLTFWTFFKPVWDFNPMIVFANQTFGKLSKESQFQVTPSSKWSLFKLDLKQWPSVSNRLELTIKRFRGVVDTMAIDDIEITKGKCAETNKKHIIDCDFESRTLTECNSKVSLSNGWKIVRDFKDKTFDGKLVGSYAKYRFHACPKESTALSTTSIDITESSCIKFWYRVTNNVSMSSSVVKTIDNEILDKYSNPGLIGTTQGLWLPAVFDNDVFNNWTLSISGSCPNQAIMYREQTLSVDDLLVNRGKCDLENSLMACDFESDSCLWFSVSKDSFKDGHSLESSGMWERSPAIELINMTKADVTFPVTDATGNSDGSYLLLDNAQARGIGVSESKKGIFLSPLFSWPETSSVANETVTNASVACLSFWSISNHEQELLIAKLSELNTILTPFSNDVNVHTDIWRQQFVQISRESNSGRFFHIAIIGMLRNTNNYVAVDNINFGMGETCPVGIKDFICGSDTNDTIDGSKVCDFVKDCANGEDETNCGYKCSFVAKRGGQNYCKWRDIRPTLDSWTFRGSAIVSNFLNSQDMKIGLRSPQFKGSISECNLNFTYAISSQFHDPGIDFQIFLSIEHQEKFMIFASKTRQNYFPTNAIVNIGKITKTFEIFLRLKRGQIYETVSIYQYHLENCIKFNYTQMKICADGEFKCSNGKCIHSHNVCNLDDDCEDNSDEIDCYENEIENWACTFENDICDFSTTTNWRIQKAALRHLLIGPTRDHTTNSPNGKVLFLRSPIGQNEEISGTIELQNTISKCFTMFYQAKNSERSMLNVNGMNYQLKSEPGSWSKIYVSGLDKKSKLEITATVQSGDWFAVDDFSFGVNCSAESNIVPVPITTTTSTSISSTTDTSSPTIPTPSVTPEPTGTPTSTANPTIAPPTKLPTISPTPVESTSEPVPITTTETTSVKSIPSKPDYGNDGYLSMEIIEPK